MGIYCVSKAGEHCLAQVLAYELGKDNIRVNVLAPGSTRTNMTRSSLEYDNAKIEKTIIGRTALGRIADLEDMLGVALFLASDPGRFVTGQTLAVDGGAVTCLY